MCINPMLRLLSVAFLSVLVLLGSRTPSRSFTHGVLPQCTNLVAVGDSITVGFGATAPYPATIATALSTTASNQGVGATGWNYNSGGTTGGNSLINLAAANVDPLLASLTCNGSQPYLILFAGTNDIFYGASGATTYASFQTYLAARISAGWLASHIIAVPILKRSGDSDADRAAYNSGVINGAGSYLLARTDLDANIGCSTCNTNLTYFQSDQVHPTNAGLNIIAHLVCVSMNPLSGTCPP
jgi:lysophospholipase L1-like esterase